MKRLYWVEVPDKHGGTRMIATWAKGRQSACMKIAGRRIHTAIKLGLVISVIPVGDTP